MLHTNSIYKGKKKRRHVTLMLSAPFMFLFWEHSIISAGFLPSVVCKRQQRAAPERHHEHTNCPPQPLLGRLRSLETACLELTFPLRDPVILFFKENREPFWKLFRFLQKINNHYNHLAQIYITNDF